MKEIGVSAKQAGLALSVFGISIMIGRFITSAIPNLTAFGAKIIAIVAAISTVLIYVLSGTHSLTFGMVIAGLTGLAFAPVFPTVLGVTIAKYDPKYYGSIFGMIFALGLLGSGLIAQLIGKASGSGSVQTGFLVPVIVAFVLIIVARVTGKTKARQSGE